MPLDPQARDFLDRLAAANLKPIESIPVSEARAQMDLSTHFLGPLPHVARAEDRHFEGPGGTIRVRLLRPSPRDGADSSAGRHPAPALVYFHGGGWVLGNLTSHEHICRAIANEAGAVVIAVDYRLAPEHRFPAAAEDALAATTWAITRAEEFGLDARRIAVGGDSAGGNLAAAACLMARDAGGPRPAFQVLVYPIADCGMDTGSYREFADGYFLTAAEMAWYWDQYVPDRGRRPDPLASPCRAQDLRGLPPALVITAGCDVLRDEGELYARRLQDSGVPTTLSRYEGTIHGFVRRFPFFDQGRAAIKEIGRAVRDAIGEGGPGPSTPSVL
ncbi:Carboxylesterase NlhH [Aquisphaera giovannonii]|uniref:Carboxylesterase NlhH n=1 Tax=Aquisphaera giovannonii TaxID=406548 RepID=A0A5B9W085_9BACT|nr:alpha/beta hydrolase [Aquisphaera giovannonii]QEH33667.1 Carboxylesterase NlhH [Aquisphaera giovannonii]